jgi:ketosteroid isomerase-like protein
MAGEGLTLARRMVECWNANDMEGAYATFDQQVVARPDPDFPEGAAFGEAAARRFWESNRDSLGLGRLEIEQELDLGDRCLVRVAQQIKSPSGIESSWSWSLIITAREGKAVLVEFFIDGDRAKRALGLL